MSTDLLRQRSRWKDLLLEIRQMMASLIQQVLLYRILVTDCLAVTLCFKHIGI